MDFGIQFKQLSIPKRFEAQGLVEIEVKAAARTSAIRQRDGEVSRELQANAAMLATARRRDPGRWRLMKPAHGEGDDLAQSTYKIKGESRGK